jgi:hypothetical protein
LAAFTGEAFVLARDSLIAASAATAAGAAGDATKAAGASGS